MPSDRFGHRHGFILRSRFYHCKSVNLRVGGTDIPVPVNVVVVVVVVVVMVVVVAAITPQFFSSSPLSQSSVPSHIQLGNMQSL